MNDFHEGDRRTDTTQRAPSERRRYEPPIIESGEAFERVQLASGCDSGLFDGCEVPCDA